MSENSDHQKLDNYNAQHNSIYTSTDLYLNVTLVVEMKDKDFTSHKAKYALQFGTNIFMVGLSLTFKS